MEPRRSPDGTRIAYAIDAPAQLRSVAVTPNPTPHVVAGFAARVGWPSWSSDGSWIA
jgi:Tol biopolymer transport system component